MAYISRFIENTILNLSDEFPVIMLTGARQVGKTTVLRHIAENAQNKINFVSLDDINERTLAINDPKLFLETHKYPLIIDEFQYAPVLLHYIKIIVDDLRFKHLNDETIKCNGIFYLTGSQKFLSMKNISESLAGRVGILEMQGLSQREINGSKNIFFEIDKLNKEKYTDEKNRDILQIFENIFYGGYPELIESKMNKDSYFSSYVNTYIERDIRDLINVKDEIKFNNFLIEIAARTGQELNLNSIANDVDITIPTVKEWVSLLSNSGIIYVLQPYYENVIKRIVKRPKIYFLDTGLATYLTKYPSAEVLMNSAYSGAIFETYVVSEIIKSYLNNGKTLRGFYYYRDNSKNEIDLIYDANDTLYPIEIKKSGNPDKNYIKQFNVLNETKKKLGQGILICQYDKIYDISNNNVVFPVSFI